MGTPILYYNPQRLLHSIVTAHPTFIGTVVLVIHTYWENAHNVVVVESLSLTLATPQTCQAALSMGFSRQEYWSGLPFPSPGDLPHPGIKSGSPALQADSFLTKLCGKPYFYIISINNVPLFIYGVC